MPASLSHRDELILNHVGRYRLTTNSVLHTLFFASCQLNAVTKVSARMCRDDYLRRHPFYHPRVYFTLGSRGASLLGLPDNRILPLGPQSLPIEYGVLAYAALGHRSLTRLTRSELERLIPGIESALVEQPYCGDEDQVELVRVDLGGAPDHVARKILGDIEVRVASEKFRSVIRQGRFRLVVVTSTPEKASAIHSAIGHHDWPNDLKFHIAVVPDLLLLTVRVRHAT